MDVRLSKLMSERKICSRREGDCFIERGMVIVDGKVVSTLGTKVSPNVAVELLSEARKEQRSKVTILLNKPVGYVSTQPERSYRPAIDLIVPENQVRERGDPILKPAHLEKLSPAGRLDIDSKGLLILTQDGSVVKAIIGPESEMEKEYLVRVNEEVTEDAIRKLRFGLSLDGKALKRAKVDLLHPTLLRIVLREGKKRQIRRMCELVTLRAISLKRVRVGKISLGNLPVGKWRFIDKSAMVSYSSDMAIKEHSCGIIPLRQRGEGWEVLLILHGKGHWAFPKGHRDRDEKPLQTAVRELREETGLEIARFVAAPPLSERYFFTWEGQKVDKSVEYYLAEVFGEVKLQTAEVFDYRWLSTKEAEALATYSEAKRLCREVEKYL